MLITCPLCLASGHTEGVHGADDRRYHLCHNCALIFVDARHHVSLEKEKARYATHQNSVDNEGYVRFLNRVLHPMLPYLDSTMRGLDYGCGPGPTLSQLVKQQGIACEDYDPFFADSPPKPPYDFIFSTECFEHFHRPSEDIQRLCSLLKPGGLLAIMTERWATLEQFATWHYTNDETHTSFYHQKTFMFLCSRFGLDLLWQDEKSVVILRRSQPRRNGLGSPGEANAEQGVAPDGDSAARRVPAAEVVGVPRVMKQEKTQMGGRA
ncbi:MAG: class I SAM-dependent methyltransferase [Verrucomicrobia bacterium]|nr:class I SAM-dependent methyltransferase [Verrucomicrobiota bacterium]